MVGIIINDDKKKVRDYYQEQMEEMKAQATKPKFDFGGPSPHPAMLLHSIPEPRPDLLIIRMDNDQVTQSEAIHLLNNLTNQENWRRTIGTIVKAGGLINKSVWGDKLKEGDKVIIATSSGDVYLIKDELTNGFKQYRIINPGHVLALTDGDYSYERI